MADEDGTRSLAELLDLEAIDLDAHADSKEEAVRACGEALVRVGAVEPAYVDAMLERERTISTYVGEGVAIPHGTLAGKEAVVRDALLLPALRRADRLGRRRGHRVRGHRGGRATATSRCSPSSPRC